METLKADLKLGELYTKKELSTILNDPNIEIVREGIYTSNRLNQMLLFVDLVKKGKEARFHFNDYFEEDYFHWDSQTKQHINSPRIQKIIKKEVDVLLFCRINPKVKNITQPFIYCGKLEYIDYFEKTTKPVHIVFNSKDFDESTKNINLKEIYSWRPENIGQSTTNNIYSDSKKNKNTFQKKPNYTERKGLVTSRVGQGWYRDAILKKWNYKCAVTGCSLVNILISSHIKSWSESNDDERLDPNNGILLSPNIDSLFDKHLISFQDDGFIIISNKIEDENLNKLGIVKTIKIEVNSDMKTYLKYHRNKFYETQK